MPSSGLRTSCEYTSGDTTLTDLGEPAAREERCLERQAEQAGDAKLARDDLERFDESPSDATVQPFVGDEQGAHLAEVFPHDVERAAADHRIVLVDRDEELLRGLIEHHEILAEQDATVDIGLKHRVHRRHIGSAGWAHGEVGHRGKITRAA